MELVASVVYGLTGAAAASGAATWQHHPASLNQAYVGPGGFLLSHLWDLPCKQLASLVLAGLPVDPYLLARQTAQARLCFRLDSSVLDGPLVRAAFHLAVKH